MKVAVDEKFYSYKYVTVVVIESDSRVILEEYPICKGIAFCK